MNADHQLVVMLIFLYQLQGAGFVGMTMIDGVAQQQQHGFSVGKLGSLIDGMAKAPFLTLVDIAQALADI